MQELSIDGKQYKFPSQNEYLKELLGCARKNLPDPFEALPDLSKFPPKLQEVMIRDAMERRRKPKSIDDEEIQAWLKTPEGFEDIMLLLFRKHQPQLTFAEILEINKQAVKEHGQDWFANLLG